MPVSYWPACKYGIWIYPFIISTITKKGKPIRIELIENEPY